jgi:hypothetical protein
MRIINLLDRELQSIEAPLLSMASSADRVEAYCGRKLLELAQYLEAQGPPQKACGYLFSRALWLSPLDNRDLTDRVSATVCVDWRDGSAWNDGNPEWHYRLQIKRKNSVLTEDARVKTPEELEHLLRRAFNWNDENWPGGS